MTHLRNAVFCWGLLLFAASPAVSADGDQVDLASVYMNEAVAGGHQIRLTGELGGTGELQLDPNRCGVDEFGNLTFCTRMAARPVPVKFELLKQNKIAGLFLYAIKGEGLRETLRLVVPENNEGNYRLVAMTDGKVTRVVTLEGGRKREANEGQPENGSNCDPLSRTVDGTTATAKVTAQKNGKGFVLTVSGKKPSISTVVTLSPVRYIAQPDFWEIPVLDCRTGDIGLPAIGNYEVTLELDSTLGKKGIEVVWADGKRERIEIESK
ncbi:hypothetical protein [Stratiformator vulcanicus]|uniref:Uncharacterized protein n=1 Tax=Stratiformator vulcanicus TaxID=2527980 RepID=A0A517R4Z2_9PLAN|nr:hypothetical protein [Stratiformator vulcanicus]QDT38958.1 hypothetical protein Pan189_33580 [Stratiformator vulcanicus]